MIEFPLEQLPSKFLLVPRSACRCPVLLSFLALAASTPLAVPALPPRLAPNSSNCRGTLENRSCDQSAAGHLNCKHACRSDRLTGTLTTHTPFIKAVELHPLN